MHAFGPVIVSSRAKTIQRGFAYHKCGALDLHESGEVLDFVGGGQLASSGDTEGEETLVHDGVEVSASGIDGGSVTCWPRATDVSLQCPQIDQCVAPTYPMMTSFECILRESNLESPVTGEVRVLCEAAAATGNENKDRDRGVARRKIEANSLAACAAVACRMWRVGRGVGSGTCALKGSRGASGPRFGLWCM